MRLVLFLLSFFLADVAYSVDLAAQKSWLNSRYRLSNPTIVTLEPRFMGKPLFFGFNMLKAPAVASRLGTFDRGIVYYENGGIFYPILLFNGPIVLNPNGNRIFDFSTPDYNYLDFFGWEVSFYEHAGLLRTSIDLRQGKGEGVADGLSIYFDQEYEQFVKSRSPFDYNYSLNWEDPKLIGIARTGYAEPNDFENTVDSELKKLTKEELRLCRNAIYAVHGYNFNDAYLRSYFYQFNWYMPGTKDENDKIVLTEAQTRLKEAIQKMERN